ncbi:hypothetical protein ACLOJK_039248 [Asimina triloba]
MKASTLGGDWCGGVIVRAEASDESGAALSTVGDGWPGSTDPGLADDGDEADGCGRNRRRDELGKKTIGTVLDLKWVMTEAGWRWVRRRRRSLRRPDLVAMVDVDLRPRWIWVGLDVAGMIDGLDGFIEVRHRWVFIEEDDGVVLTILTVQAATSTAGNARGGTTAATPSFREDPIYRSDPTCEAHRRQ